MQLRKYDRNSVSEPDSKPILAMDLDSSKDVADTTTTPPCAPISKVITDTGISESGSVADSSDLSYSTEEGESMDGHIVCDSPDDVYVDRLTSRKLRRSSSLSLSFSIVEDTADQSPTPSPDLCDTNCVAFGSGVACNSRYSQYSGNTNSSISLKSECRIVSGAHLSSSTVPSATIPNTVVDTNGIQVPQSLDVGKLSSPPIPSPNSSPMNTRRPTRTIRTRLFTRMQQSREASPTYTSQDHSSSFPVSTTHQGSYSSAIPPTSSIVPNHHYPSHETATGVSGKHASLRRLETVKIENAPNSPMVLMDVHDPATIIGGDTSDSIVLRLRKQSQARLTPVSRAENSPRTSRRLTNAATPRTRLATKHSQQDGASTSNPHQATTATGNEPARGSVSNTIHARRQGPRSSTQKGTSRRKRSQRGVDIVLSPYDLFEYDSLKASIHALRTESFVARYRPVLLEIMSHSNNGGIFNFPVSPIELGIPDYFDVIKKPMDLGTVRLKLEAGEYSTPEELHADVLLVFDNACLYNKPFNPVHIAAKKLREEYLAKITAITVKESTEEKKKGGHNCAFCQGQRCVLCGDKCLRFDADVISCDCCFDKIKRGETYFRASTGQRWCEKCISNGGANVEPGAILPPLALLKSASIPSLEELMHHLGITPGVVSLVAATAISHVLKHRTGNFKAAETAIRKAVGLRLLGSTVENTQNTSESLKKVKKNKNKVANNVVQDQRPALVVDNTDVPLQPQGTHVPSTTMALPTLSPHSQGSGTSSPDTSYSRQPIPSPPNMNPGLWNIILSAYAPYGSSQAMKATNDNRAWLAQQQQKMYNENTLGMNMMGSVSNTMTTQENNAATKSPCTEVTASSPVSQATIPFPTAHMITGDLNSSVYSVDGDPGFSVSKLDTPTSANAANMLKKYMNLSSEDENPTEIETDTSTTYISTEPTQGSPNSTQIPGDDVQTPSAFSLTPFATVVRSMGSSKRTLEKNYTPKQLLATLGAAAVCRKSLAKAAKEVYTTFVSTGSVQKSSLLKLSSILRGRLEKRRNDNIMVEPWVQCDCCGRWSHQICSLFNARKNSIMQSPGGYTCPMCRLDRLEAKSQTGPSSTTASPDVPSTTSLAAPMKEAVTANVPPPRPLRITNPIGISEAKDIPVPGTSTSFPTASSLPHTPLSEYLEQQVRLKIAESASPLVASSITVRLVSSLTRTMQVPHDARTIFTAKPLPPKELFTCLGEMEGKYGTTENAPDSPRSPQTNASTASDDTGTPLSYAAEYKYQQRVVLLWQRIDGIDVLLFALYVQEYDASNPLPNKNKIYIAYLDSVRYLRPLNVRTVCYHGLLSAYLTHARSRGFDSAYIWSCPPQRGEGYIFHRHPRSQRTPDKTRLREWYDTMLREMQKQGTIESVKSLFDTHFDVVQCDSFADLDKTMNNANLTMEQMNVDSPSVSISETTNINNNVNSPRVAEDGLSVGEKRKQSVDDVSVIKSARHGQNSTPSTPTLSAIPLAPVSSRMSKGGKSGKASKKSKQASGRVSSNQYEIVCLRQDMGLPPYFAGDYWACEMEKWIRDVHKRIVSKITGKHALRDISAFYSRARDAQNINTWTGDAAEESDEEDIGKSASPYAALVHSYVQTFPPTVAKDKHTFRVGEFEIPRHPVSSLALRLRHMQKEIFVVRFTPLTTPLPPSVVPNLPSFDPVYGDKDDRESMASVEDTKSVSCDFFDTRQGFLRMCQGNHYQFDTLRRAKHSSVMILWHLHNPRIPAYAHSCSRCECDLSFGKIIRWHCEVCYNFDICDKCYKQGIVHEHELTLYDQTRSSRNGKATPSTKKLSALAVP